MDGDINGALGISLEASSYKYRLTSNIFQLKDGGGTVQRTVLDSSLVPILLGALVLLSSMLFVSYHLIIDYDSAPYAVSPQVCSMIDRFR